MVVVTGRSGDHTADYRKVAIQRSQAEAGKGPKGEGHALRIGCITPSCCRNKRPPNLSGLGVCFLLLALHN